MGLKWDWNHATILRRLRRRSVFTKHAICVVRCFRFWFSITGTLPHESPILKQHTMGQTAFSITGVQPPPATQEKTNTHNRTQAPDHDRPSKRKPTTKPHLSETPNLVAMTPTEQGLNHQHLRKSHNHLLRIILLQPRQSQPHYHHRLHMQEKSFDNFRQGGKGLSQHFAPEVS